MSEENEKSGGGVAKTVGFVGAGAGTLYAMDKAESRKGIKQALAGDEKAPKKIAEKVSGALEKDAALVERNTSVKNLNVALKDPAAVKSLQFNAGTGEKALHNLSIKGQTASMTAKNVALPKGATAGVAITEQKAIKSTLEGTRKTAENALVKDVRSAGGIKFGSGFSNAGGMGKGKIIAGTVAVAAVGAMVANKLFGGKHSDRVQAERQVQQDLGRA